MPQLASLNVAAEFAQVHPRTLRRYIAAGLLPAYRLGPRLVKVDLADVEALFVPIGGAS